MSLSSQSQNEADCIYFDNGATSFPKPETVIMSIVNTLKEAGGNPGRSAHSMAVKSGEILFDFREHAASMFGLENPMRVIPTLNGTEALNLAIQGVLGKGGHAVTTSMEHNSTIRPLKELEKEGRISLSVLPCSSRGILDPQDLKKALRKRTSLVVINHGSNVFGSVQNLEEISSLCSQSGVPLLVDASQTAGVLPIDLSKTAIDLLAFAGHKGLYGPMGTGALLISENFDYRKIRPLKFGGTGSYSDRIEQPPFLPDFFESGTPNICGLSGLSAGIDFVSQTGLQVISAHKKELVRHLLCRCTNEVDRFINYLKADEIETGVVSFNIDGISCSEVSMILSEDYGIMNRQGMHCAPLAHKTFGTFPSGTVRFSFGYYNTKDQVDRSVEALKNISKGRYE